MGRGKPFQDLAQRFTEDQELMLIVESRGRTVGGAFAFKKSRRGVTLRMIALICHVAVWNPLQGFGIGIQLMHAADEEIVERGLRWSQMGVERVNTGARRLYERLGYVTFSDQDLVWPEPTPEGGLAPVPHPSWMMRKDLGRPTPRSS